MLKGKMIKITPGYNLSSFVKTGSLVSVAAQVTLNLGWAYCGFSISRWWIWILLGFIGKSAWTSRTEVLQCTLEMHSCRVHVRFKTQTWPMTVMSFYIFIFFIRFWPSLAIRFKDTFQIQNKQSSSLVNRWHCFTLHGSMNIKTEL